MEFLKDFFLNKEAKVFCPEPTWPFHYPISWNCGFETVKYRYYDRSTKSFDLQGMLEDLDKAPDE